MKLELVDEWRRCWRWGSVRLAWATAPVIGFFTSYPDELKGLVAYVPDHWRPLAALAIALLVGAIPTIARIVKKKAPADG